MPFPNRKRLPNSAHAKETLCCSVHRETAGILSVLLSTSLLHGSCFHFSELGGCSPPSARVYSCWSGHVLFTQERQGLGPSQADGVPSSALFSTEIPSEFYSGSPWSDPCLIRISNSSSLHGAPATHPAYTRACLCAQSTSQRHTHLSLLLSPVFASP